MFIPQDGCDTPRTVKHFEMVGFTDDNTDPGFLLEVRRRVNRVMLTVPGPMLVHCRQGEKVQSFCAFCLPIPLSFSVSVSIKRSLEGVYRRYRLGHGFRSELLPALSYVSKTMYMRSTSSIARPNLLFVLSSMSSQLSILGQYLGIDFSMLEYQLSFVTVQVPYWKYCNDHKLRCI